MGLQVPSEDELNDQLKQAFENSKKKKYHGFDEVRFVPNTEKQVQFYMKKYEQLNNIIENGKQINEDELNWEELLDCFDIVKQYKYTFPKKQLNSLELIKLYRDKINEKLFFEINLNQKENNNNSSEIGIRGGRGRGGLIGGIRGRIGRYRGRHRGSRFPRVFGQRRRWRRDIDRGRGRGRRGAPFRRGRIERGRGRGERGRGERGRGERGRGERGRGERGRGERGRGERGRGERGRGERRRGERRRGAPFGRGRGAHFESRPIIRNIPFSNNNNNVIKPVNNLKREIKINKRKFIKKSEDEEILRKLNMKQLCLKLYLEEFCKYFNYIGDFKKLYKLLDFVKDEITHFSFVISNQGILRSDYNFVRAILSKLTSLKYFD